MWVNGVRTTDYIGFGTLYSGATTNTLKIGKDSSEPPIGLLDDLRIWVNYTLTQADVDRLYNAGAGLDDPLISTATFLAPTPESGASNLTNVSINVSCSDASKNVTLWFDSNANPITKVISNYSNPSNYTTRAVTQGTYYYKASCDSGLTNSSVRIWSLDTDPISIVLNPTNFFTSLNYSTQPQFGTNVTANISAIKSVGSGIFKFHLNITNSSNELLYSYVNNGVGGITYFNFTASNISPSNWHPNQRYKIKVFAENSVKSKTEYYSWYLGNYTQSGNTVLSNKQTNLTLAMMSDSSISNIVAYLNFNGTLYSATKTYSIDTDIFSYTVPALSVATDTDIPFNWSVTVYQNGQSYNFNTSKLNYTVYRLYIDNCTNGLGLKINSTLLNISWYDSDLNRQYVNATYIINYSEDSGTLSYLYSNQEKNILNDSICGYPGWVNFTTDIYINYLDTSGDNYAYTGLDYRLDNATNYLTLYVTPAASQVKFTAKDKQTKKIITDVIATQYKLINGEWTVLETKLTDITGRVQFNYIPNVNYKFLFSKSSYDDYPFSLNPVLFSEYDVPLTKATQINLTPDYDRVQVYYTPQLYKNGANNFSFVISSPYNELLDYGYTLTYPSSTASNSGSNTAGEILTSQIDITPTSSLDRVRLDYYYITEIAGRRNFTYYYPISRNTNVNYNLTMKGRQDPTFGMSMWERITVCTIAMIFLVGIAHLIGKGLAGFAIGIALWGYFVYIEFIPLWSILLSITIGLIIIAKRSEV